LNLELPISSADLEEQKTIKREGTNIGRDQSTSADLYFSAATAWNFASM